MEKQSVNLFERLMSSPAFRFHRFLMIQALLLLLSLNVFGTSSELFIFDNGRIFLYLIFYGALNLVCYLNIYLLVPRWLLTNKIGKYTAAVAGATVLFLFILMCSHPLADHHESAPANSFLVVLNVFSSFLTVVFIIISTTTLLLFRYWAAEQQRIQELKIATGEYELQLLKQQINPHFLFNTLNNANVLLKRKPDEASQVLFKLEDLLRYQLDDCKHEKVALTDEIRFLNDYLNLEKIRRDHFDFSISQDDATADIRIEPLLFIVFVENAVKHNPDSRSLVSLSFAMHDGMLEFRCKNTKSSTATAQPCVGGLGLNNIRRRLQLLYPQRHSLEIDDTETDYSVRLMINCKTR